LVSQFDILVGNRIRLRNRLWLVGLVFCPWLSGGVLHGRRTLIELQFLNHSEAIEAGAIDEPFLIAFQDCVLLGSVRRCRVVEPEVVAN
jgi:hypothetical protein